MSSNIHIFTHNDLDGIGCLQALIWCFPEADISYTTISSVSEFNKEYHISNKKKEIDSYDKVFVTDLSLLEQDLNLIDKKNVIFIDHHKTSLNFKFINAANFTRLFSSCTLLIYKLFKSSLDINNYQKNLLILIDDYDSYKLSFSKTKNLNILFWAHYYNNVPLFLSDFNDGFNQFNSLQNKIINIQKQKISDTIKNLKPFYTKTKIQNIECNVVAAFADTAINDVSDYLLQQYNADISIVVNLKSDRVSFRRKNTAIDLSILAKKLCNGGGHEAAAGGKITEIFLEFTKIFSET